VDNSPYASTSQLAGKLIEETVPGIKSTAILVGGFQGDVKTGDKAVPLKGFLANESVFKVFSFPLLQGDPATALANPNTIVLTESSSQKLFGDKDPIGETVTIHDDQYVVTGIMKNIPKFSHIKFEMLASLRTREVTNKKDDGEMSWGNIWYTYVYLVLHDDTQVENVEQAFRKLCEEQNKTIENRKISLHLQPLSAIALGPDLNNSVGRVMSDSEVLMTGLLCFTVLLSACFNYTNLSVARSLRRAREVGVRKIIGALRSHVLGQFMIESILICLLALVLSLVGFVLLRPFYLSLEPKLSEMLDLDLSIQLVLYFVLFAITVGILAGFFPALFFSRINALQVLRNTTSIRLFRRINFRKALIVVQFIISLSFIAATIIGHKQYKYLVAFDLGYNTENIVNIWLEGNKPDLMIKELREIPEVKEISKSLIITSVGNYWGTNMKYKDPSDSTFVYYNGVDEHYLPLHDIQLLAGRNFTPLTSDSVESEVIVNEKVLKRFNIANRDPLKALDELVEVDGKKMKIIGVLKDYHYGKADGDQEEVVFRYRTDDVHFINAKITTNDWLLTMSKIEKAWKKVDKTHPLQAKIYNDQLKHSYRELSTMIWIMGMLSFLAICISSMGLLGMVVFATETRLREVSIRKVLGASERSLVYLLGKGFIILLLIAACIALPLTYLFFDQVALPEMHNHAPIEWIDLAAGLFGLLTVALILIGSQTVKVARSNPADVLKSE
jgi:ABC-type antimicrobial peptide transport system permease subunit